MRKLCFLTALCRHISFSQDLTETLCMSQKDAEMGAMLSIKVIIPAWLWDSTCLGRNCEQRNCRSLFWLVLCSKKQNFTYFICKKTRLHHRNTRLHFLSGQKLFWQVSGPKGRMFFMGVTVLREKPLILLGFLQEYYSKLLEFHTVIEFIITESNDCDWCI